MSKKEKMIEEFDKLKILLAAKLAKMSEKLDAGKLPSENLMTELRKLTREYDRLKEKLKL